LYFAPFPRYNLGKVPNRYIWLPVLGLSPTEGFPWDDLRKIFIERSQLAKVPNDMETLPKISIA